MNLALWIVQVLLAGAFGWVGFQKLTQPVEQLALQWGWVNDVTPNTVIVIGALEVLGAAGLILPRLTGIWPWLTPVAASGLMLTMVGAMLVHARRHEYGSLLPNLVLLLLAVFVAYGRFVAAPA